MFSTTIRLLGLRVSLKPQRRSLNVVARPSDLIGNTPLIDLGGILQKHGVDGTFVMMVVMCMRVCVHACTSTNNNNDRLF